MISFACDYLEGAHPQVLEALSRTNLIQQSGYGTDEFTAEAIRKIRLRIGCPDADVFFLGGGTQTNSTVIASLLRDWEGVVSPVTGHIAVHEAGAVEYTGHKVLPIPSHSGLIDSGELSSFLASFHSEPAKDHMVYPGMLYISFPSEYGTIYSKSELWKIRQVCDRYGIPLFIDGARLGYGLASPRCDLGIEDIAALSDVFYIGGTKVGALCGEAVVFPRGNAPRFFFTTIKQHGALFAKGRVVSVQFDALFTDDLYFRISSHAIEMAMRLKKIFIDKGYSLFMDSPTNQQFVILDDDTLREIAPLVGFEMWEKLPSGDSAVRFATSWATTDSQLEYLESVLPDKNKQ